MIEGFNAWASREDCWYSVVLNTALLLLDCLLLFSVRSSEQRLGVGEWILCCDNPWVAKN